MRTLASFLVLLAVCPLALADGGKKGEKVEPHADELVESARERFSSDFKSQDMDRRIRILRWYGQHMHKSVLKDLRKIYLKDKNLELQAAAAMGLGHQLPYTRDAAGTLIEGLRKYEKYASRAEPKEEEELDQELEAKVLAETLKGLARLEFHADKKGWKFVRGFADHNHDDVAIAWFEYCGLIKEWRALPIILEWFNFYPDGYSWAGGSTRVDTGAAGNKDAKAAKAKWHAKYGKRARKARPKAHEAMRKTLKDITGKEFDKPKELKAWMKENKKLLKKNGV